VAKVPPPEVPRGALTPEALGLWFTKFKSWAPDLVARVLALETAPAAVAAAADGTDFGAYRHKPGNSSLSPWNIAGAAVGDVLGAMTAMTANANQLFAFPFVAPKRGGTLTALAYDSNNANGVSHMGVWANKANDDLYPGALLLDAGNKANSAALKTYTGLTVSLTAGSLYWIGYEVDDATAAIRKLASTLMSSMLGVPFGGTGCNQGIKVAHALAAFSATFPAGGAYTNVATDPTPALGYQVS
jgi:hypothetical protein